VAEEEYIARSIREPAAEQQDGYPAGIMPKISLTDGEIRDIVRFLKTVK
jgi:hypothetical protein